MSQTQAVPELLTKEQAAEYSTFSYSTIRRWMEEGLLPYIKIGNGRGARVRIRRSDIDAMMDAHLRGGDAE